MGFYLEVNQDSVPTTYRLFCAEGDQARGVTMTENNTVMNLNYGVGGSLRLSTSPSGTSGNWSYFPVLGKTISWTVDLSNVPCGLNATFYSVVLEQGWGYRDACATFPSTTELDFMEANRYSWHTTLHRGKNDCGSAPPIGIGGTVSNASDPRYLFHDLVGQAPANTLYGPGENYQINTLLPFQASISFHTESEVLVAVALVLSQGGHAIGQSFTETNEEYKGWLAGLGKEIVTGNVGVWSLWTGNLNWLESPPCGKGSSPKCTNTSCQYTMSNFCISSC